MKPGSKDIKLEILISGKELSEIKHHSWQMIEAFWLDRRIEKYKGKHPIGLYSWDFDCILAVLENALDGPTEYPDKKDTWYKVLESLCDRLKGENRKFD